MNMRILRLPDQGDLIAAVFLFSFVATPMTHAEPGIPSSTTAPLLQETLSAVETAGVEESGPNLSDVEVVSANGSITRKRCPHSCVDRGIPKKSCKEWRSMMYPDVCYVEDLSKPSQAIEK
jgi:hypothetical protein